MFSHKKNLEKNDGSEKGEKNMSWKSDMKDSKPGLTCKTNFEAGENKNGMNKLKTLQAL